MERVTITVEDNCDFLLWERVCLDGKPIGVISRNKEIDDDYYFAAFGVPQWIAKLEYAEDFCGYADTLMGAHNLAQEYANYLIKEGF